MRPAPTIRTRRVPELRARLTKTVIARSANRAAVIAAAHTSTSITKMLRGNCPIGPGVTSRKPTAASSERMTALPARNASRALA